MAAAARALAVAAVLVAGSGLAEERFDHRGAVGLLLGGGLEWKEAVSLARVRDGGLRYGLDLGGTYAIGYDGNELVAFARGLFGGPVVDSAVFAGYRGYFGRDRLKTFFDLGLGAHFTPAFVVGPRLGFGVQYEITSIVGVYAGAGAQFAGGNGFRFSGEFVSGLQFRSYLLE